MEYIVAVSAFMSFGLVVYALITRDSKRVFLREDRGLCKCKDCKHIETCKAFVGLSVFSKKD